VVAPIVRRGRRGAWIGVLKVARGFPELGQMVLIAQAALGPTAEIVVMTREPAAPRDQKRLRIAAVMSA
jgi:hypothetical protein